MPIIKISGISREKLCEIGDKVIDILDHDMNISRDRVKLYHLPIEEIRDGKIVENKTVNIEIEWYARSQELCDKLAYLYKTLFASLGYDRVRVYISEILKEHNYDFK